MFSVVSVCHSVHGVLGGGPHVTITYDASDLTVHGRAASPSPAHFTSDIKLVH